MPIHSSHWSAVRVRIGSMAITRAPCSRAAEHERPEMRVGRERVRAPQQHEVAFRESLGVGADVGADGHPHAHRAGRRADGAVELRRAEHVEEPAVHRLALQQAHRAGVRVREDRLRAFGRSTIARSRAAMSPSASSHDTGSNLPLPLGPTRRSGRSRRSRWYVRSTYRFTFAQRKPFVNGWSGSPGNAHGTSVLDRHQHRARVGAVVRARAADHAVLRESREIVSAGRGGHWLGEAAGAFKIGIR